MKKNDSDNEQHEMEVIIDRSKEEDNNGDDECENDKLLKKEYADIIDDDEYFHTERKYMLITKKNYWLRVLKKDFSNFKFDSLFNCEFIKYDNDTISIVISYISGILLFGSWWALFCITLFTQKFYDNIEGIWIGVVSWYYWIPGFISTFGFFLMFKSKHDPTDTEFGEDTENRSRIFISLILLISGFVAALWIKIENYGFNSPDFICINSTQTYIKPVNCTFDYETGEIGETLNIYQGGGWVIIVQTFSIIVSAILSRNSRIYGNQL